MIEHVAMHRLTISERSLMSQTPVKGVGIGEGSGHLINLVRVRGV